MRVLPSQLHIKLLLIDLKSIKFDISNFSFPLFFDLFRLSVYTFIPSSQLTIHHPWVQQHLYQATIEDITHNNHLHRLQNIFDSLTTDQFVVPSFHPPLFHVLVLIATKTTPYLQKNFFLKEIYCFIIETIIHLIFSD